MNYNFGEDVRDALGDARQAAFERGHDFVGTEHVLLGITSAQKAHPLLTRLGLDPISIRAKTDASIRRGQGGVRLGELPYSFRAKKVLEFAMAAARDSRSDGITTEHLLAGLLREKSGIAAAVLAEFGVAEREGRVYRAEVKVPVKRRPEVRIDDASDRSIYEQIVAQITEAIATGDLTPGVRLQTVRQLADELDVAPGTVARAYSELERQGLVVTDGARGTRVADRQPAAAGPLANPEALSGLLRPVVVAAFHLGATAEQLRGALETAMEGIFRRDGRAA